MDKSKIYNDSFYRNRNLETRYSANKIEAIILKYFQVQSAVDVGCGVGTWLNELRKHGVERVKGLDGDYVNRNYLVISKDEFIPTDLSNKITLNEKFDLAISLEVAEHLKPSRAKGFVEDLCRLSDVVLFSAATLKQGGDDHVNEQRLSYWINKFNNQGYDVIDIIRPQIWNDRKIPVWYRENIVVFVNRTKKECILREEIKSPPIYDMIHPDLYEIKMREYEELKNSVPVQIYLKLKELGKKYRSKD